MQCINHNEAQSQALCTRCDRPLCAACLHDFQGKTYCSDCATFVRQRFETRAAQAQAHATTGAALDAAVVAAPIERRRAASRAASSLPWRPASAGRFYGMDPSS